MNSHSVRWLIFSCVLFALITLGNFIAVKYPEVKDFYTSFVGGGILTYLMMVFTQSEQPPKK